MNTKYEHKPLTVDQIREAIKKIVGVDPVSIFAEYQDHGRYKLIKVTWDYLPTCARIVTPGHTPDEVVQSVIEVADVLHKKDKAETDALHEIRRYEGMPASLLCKIQDGGIPHVRWEGPEQ